jgi:hypothetical protein
MIYTGDLRGTGNKKRTRLPTCKHIRVSVMPRLILMTSKQSISGCVTLLEHGKSINVRRR